MQTADRPAWASRRSLQRALIRGEASPTLIYPDTAAARDRFVLDLRGPKTALDPQRAYAAVWEEERDDTGAPGADRRRVPHQSRMPIPVRDVRPVGQHARRSRCPAAPSPARSARRWRRLPPARQIKLYNAGSFFDPQAIPVDDFEEIAAAVSGFDRVIVEAASGIPSRPSRRRVPAVSRPAARTARGGGGARDRAPRGPRRVAQADDGGGCRRGGGVPVAPRHRAPRCSSCSTRRSCRTTRPPTGRSTRSAPRRGMGAAVCAVIPTRGGNGAIDALPVESRPRLGLRDLEWVVQEALGDGAPHARVRRSLGHRAAVRLRLLAGPRRAAGCG